jgi:DNA primase
MFPIQNESGKIIGYGGRALSSEDEPKYLNSPETPLYKKTNILFNLHRAKEAMRKEDRAILVEGYMDAIGVTAAGFGNVVASCGTALTDKQVQALKRFTHRIAVNFDPDTAGANASERSIDMLLAESMQVRIVELEEGLDPDEYCKEHGSDAYAGRIEHAKGYFYWLADRARAKHDTRTPEGKVAVLEFLLPKVQRISDTLERMTIANDVAGYLGVSQGMVLDRFKKAVTERAETTIRQPKSPLRHDERMLLNAMLTDAEVRTLLIEQMKELETLETLPSRRLFQAIFALDDAGGRVGFDEVNARLETEDQNLLAQAVLSDDGEISREDVMAALGSLRRTEDHNRRVQLKARIGELERTGKFEEALRVTMELQGLERSSAGRRGGG